MGLSRAHAGPGVPGTSARGVVLRSCKRTSPTASYTLTAKRACTEPRPCSFPRPCTQGACSRLRGTAGLHPHKTRGSSNDVYRPHPGAVAAFGPDPLCLGDPGPVPLPFEPALAGFLAMEASRPRPDAPFRHPSETSLGPGHVFIAFLASSFLVHKAFKLAQTMLDSKVALLGGYYALRYLLPIFAVVATYRWCRERSNFFFTCLGTAYVAATFWTAETWCQAWPTTMLRLVYPFGRCTLTIPTYVERWITAHASVAGGYAAAGATVLAIFAAVRFAIWCHDAPLRAKQHALSSLKPQRPPATVRKPPVPTDGAANTAAATALPEATILGVKQDSADTKKHRTAEQVRDASSSLGTAAKGTDVRLQSTVNELKAQSAHITGQRSQSVMGGRSKPVAGASNTNSAEQAMAQKGSSEQAFRSTVDKPKAQAQQTAVHTTGLHRQSVMGGRSKCAAGASTNSAEPLAAQNGRFEQASRTTVNSTEGKLQEQGAAEKAQADTAEALAQQRIKQLEKQPQEQKKAAARDLEAAKTDNSEGNDKEGDHPPLVPLDLPKKLQEVCNEVWERWERDLTNSLSPKTPYDKFMRSMRDGTAMGMLEDSSTKDQAITQWHAWALKQELAKAVEGYVQTMLSALQKQQQQSKWAEEKLQKQVILETARADAFKWATKKLQEQVAAEPARADAAVALAEERIKQLEEQLQEQKEAAARDLEVLRQQHNTMLEQVQNEAAAAQQQSRMEVRKLQEAATQDSQQLGDVRLQLTNLEAKEAEACKQQRELETKLQATQADLDVWSMKRDELHYELTDAQDALEGAKADLAYTEQKLADTQEKLDKAQAELGGTQDERSCAQDKLAEAQAELEAAQELAGTGDKAVSDLRRQLIEAQEAVSKAERAANDFKCQRDMLLRQLDGISKQQQQQGGVQTGLRSRPVWKQRNMSGGHRSSNNLTAPQDPYAMLQQQQAQHAAEGVRADSSNMADDGGNSSESAASTGQSQLGAEQSAQHALEGENSADGSSSSICSSEQGHAALPDDVEALKAETERLQSQLEQVVRKYLQAQATNKALEAQLSTSQGTGSKEQQLPAFQTAAERRLAEIKQHKEQRLGELAAELKATDFVNEPERASFTLKQLGLLFNMPKDEPLDSYRIQTAIHKARKEYEDQLAGRSERQLKQQQMQEDLKRFGLADSFGAERKQQRPVQVEQGDSSDAGSQQHSAVSAQIAETSNAKPEPHSPVSVEQAESHDAETEGEAEAQPQQAPAQQSISEWLMAPPVDQDKPKAHKTTADVVESHPLADSSSDSDEPWSMVFDSDEALSAAANNADVTVNKRYNRGCVAEMEDARSMLKPFGLDPAPSDEDDGEVPVLVESSAGDAGSDSNVSNAANKQTHGSTGDGHVSTIHVEVHDNDSEVHEGVADSNAGHAVTKQAGSDSTIVVKVHDVDSEQQKDGADSKACNAVIKQSGSDSQIMINVHDADSEQQKGVGDIKAGNAVTKQAGSESSVVVKVLDADSEQQKDVVDSKAGKAVNKQAGGDSMILVKVHDVDNEQQGGGADSMAGGAVTVQAGDDSSVVVKVHHVDSKQQNDGADSSTGDAGKKQAVSAAGASEPFSFEVVVHDADSDEEEAVSDARKRGPSDAVAKQVGEGRAAQDAVATEKQQKAQKEHKAAPDRRVADEWDMERKVRWLDHGSIEKRLKTKSRLMHDRRNALLRVQQEHNNALLRAKRAQQVSEQEHKLQERKALGPIDPEKFTKLAHMNKDVAQTPPEKKKAGDTSIEEGDCEVEVVVEQAAKAIIPTTASMGKATTTKKDPTLVFRNFKANDDWVQAIVNNESLITQVQDYFPKATAKDALRLLRIGHAYWHQSHSRSVDLSDLAKVTDGEVTWLRGRITESKALYIMRLIEVTGAKWTADGPFFGTPQLLRDLQEIHEV